MKNKNIKAGYLIFDIINYLFFGLFAVCTVYPLYFVIINAISDPTLVAAGRVRFYPIDLNFSTFIEMMNLKDIPSSIFMSVARTVLGMIVAVLSSSILGYVFTKQEFKHRKFWYRYFIVTMYVSAGLIPSYLNRVELGFTNSFWFVYVIPNMVQAYNIVLVKTYMESLPEALEEAAYIDGAGYFQRFVRIVIPLSKPIIATIAIFTAVSEWNAYMDTIIYMTKGGYQTLQSTLYVYLNKSAILASVLRSGAAISDNMAASVNVTSIKYVITAVTLLPILMVYPFFQKYFTKGIMIGAVKG